MDYEGMLNNGFVRWQCPKCKLITHLETYATVARCPACNTQTFNPLGTRGIGPAASGTLMESETFFRGINCWNCGKKLVKRRVYCSTECRLKYYKKYYVRIYGVGKGMRPDWHAYGYAETPENIEKR